jgi:hypothetical protein
MDITIHSTFLVPLVFKLDKTPRVDLTHDLEE